MQNLLELKVVTARDGTGLNSEVFCFCYQFAAGFFFTIMDQKTFSKPNVNYLILTEGS